MSAGGQTRWLRVKEIFSLAAEAPAEERAAVVGRLCEGDPELRREVEELLALRDDDNLALDRPVPIQPHSLGLLPRYQTGDVLAQRYRITAFIASGGMGEVYAAVDVETDGAVALKCIRHLELDGQAEARLAREVRMAGEIQHPSVCRMHGLDQHGNDRFCVMELLAGETLAERLASRGRFSASEALPVVRQILEGLEAAHRAGVLHRDLKPANIMLTGDRAVIIDFGLAAAAPGHREITQSLTGTGALIGTLAYIAPEQLEGAKSTPASDLYSLGVILYEMLMGGKPHDAKSPFQLAAQKARESHRIPTFQARQLPPVWREAIARCLKARPEERFQSAAELRALLERGKPSLGFRFARWKRPLTVAAATVAASVLAWLGWTWAQTDHVPPPEAAALYRQAQSAMNAAAPMRATRLLERAVELDSSFVKARSMLAAAYADLDQPDKARDAVLRATSAADGRWILGRGERQALDATRAVVMRDYKLAAERYGRIAASSQGAERSQALVAKARMLEQAGQMDNARSTIETVLREDSGNGPARVRLALLLCRKRDFGRATAEFQRAELAYEKEGNLEGLCDLLLARLEALNRSAKQEWHDNERVQELSGKTGNRYHALSAKFQMARLAERERDYDRAMEVTREAAQQATREGMPVVAARAMGELGYAFLYAKRLDEGLTLLRESVEMAERSRSPATLAWNRLRLGEALGNARQAKQAVEVMEPAVAWYRQNGSQTSLPLVLIKWGTVLNATRFNEAVGAFLEALDIATRHGDESYQSVALQRLASVYARRDLRESAKYWDRALVLARKLNFTLAYFQAAGNWGNLGEFAKAAGLIAEGEREIATLYRPGVDRDGLTTRARSTRAKLDYVQGHCAAGLRIASRSKDLSQEMLWRQLQACAGSLDTSSLRRHIAWFEAQLARLPAEERSRICELSAGAGEMALRLSDWRSAKRYAGRSVEACEAGSYSVDVLTGLLVLRAAHRGLGERDAVDRLSKRVIELAAQVGFDPPERFGGRQDLLRLWLKQSIK
jgi:tetratricopeptide (TPR) repeat protein